MSSSSPRQEQAPPGKDGGGAAHRRVHRSKARRRFSTACLQCRTQKIRCVRLNANGRCVNCNMGDKPCTLVAAGSTTTGITTSGRPWHQPISPEDVYDNDSANAWAETVSKMNIEEYANQGLNNHFGYANTDVDASELGVPSPSQSSSCQSTITNPADLSTLLPNVASMGSKTVQFLNNQGCFTIPEQFALDQFFHQYFLHIHPLFPVIDEVQFWEQHRSKTTLGLVIDGRLSLLVLYGMLYTSASYAPTSLIEGLGFHDTHQAKAVFHMRAKLLYDTRFEPSSISIAQAALLLSHCYYTAPPNSFKNLAPMWLGIAVEHAKKSGADRYDTLAFAAKPATLESEELRRTLKRLWWCCIIRDRVMPLAARKNTRITRLDFDFDNHPPMDMSDFAEEIHYSTIYDKSSKRTVVEILSKFLELCVILTDVLAPNIWSDEGLEFTALQEAEHASRIRTCRSALKDWHDSFLLLQLEKRPRGYIQVGSTESSDELIILFTNIVVMYYHFATLTLSHQEMMIFGANCSLTSASDSSLTNGNSDSNQVTLATSQLVQCLMNLVRLRLAHCLPLSIVGCAMLPVALQILDLKLLSTASNNPSHLNPEAAILKQRQTRFVSLIEAIQLSRPRFNGVDWILNCIRMSVDAFHHLLFTNGIPNQSSAQILLSSKSWTDILRKQPKFYLSLATSMDFSLSNGELPEASDLPARFRTIERPKRLSSAPIYHHDMFPESLSLCDINILSHVEFYSSNLAPEKETRGDKRKDPKDTGVVLL